MERRQKDWGTGSTGQRLGGGASNPTSAAVASADEKRQAALEAVQRRQVAAVEICRVSGGGKQVVEVWGNPSRNRETKVVIVGRKLVLDFFRVFFWRTRMSFGGMMR